ncbi:uncharacterized protein LOC136091057 [Hydra vulgaris]|uniref:Uncharacterized protein LOC136091057 n=1 Tax=Hydra vulgaris TaxID=6087 RepID=A0ABM4DHZ2_HYDVU
MNQICQHCGAKKIPDETHFLCCHNGKVAFPPLSPFTQVLQDLFTGKYVDRNANGNFLKHIRNYNACLSFASFKATVVQPINHGPPYFKICGQIYHRVGGERRRYNLPSHDEVAVVFVGEVGALPTSRDVFIYPRGHLLKIVSSKSVNLDRMIYPLFFPRGGAGWHNQLVHNPARATLVRNHVTLSQFYNYRLSIRQFFCLLFYGKKLFQQYGVDAYVNIDGQCLAFIRNNQNKLRSEQYDALNEHLNKIANERNVRPGRVVILPSSYVGSPRALKKIFEDAMAIIKKYGKPDLFITFTCNPKWCEITENLYPGQTPNDRPDLVTRVFKLKLNNLNDIFKHGVIGKSCYACSDLVVNRELYDIIKACMIHDPCGILIPNSPCIKDKVRSKNYPKEFNANTVAVQNGYPQYRRHDDGLVINFKGNNVDNRWMVPYNPWLSKEYEAHINVETCMSVKAVKYLYKYIYKGHDCANCRYVSAPEALWRIFEYPIVNMSHTIFRLKIHLPENQIVNFREGEEQVALHRAAQRDTHRLYLWNTYKVFMMEDFIHRQVPFILAKQATPR